YIAFNAITLFAGSTEAITQPDPACIIPHSNRAGGVQSYIVPCDKVIRRACKDGDSIYTASRNNIAFICVVGIVAVVGADTVVRSSPDEHDAEVISQRNRACDIGTNVIAGDDHIARGVKQYADSVPKAGGNDVAFQIVVHAIAVRADAGSH